MDVSLETSSRCGSASSDKWTSDSLPEVQALPAIQKIQVRVDHSGEENSEYELSR